MRLIYIGFLLMPLMTAMTAMTAEAPDLSQIPASAGISTHGEITSWHDLQIVGTDSQRHVMVKFDGQRIAVARALVEHDDGEAANELPKLIKRATAAEIPLSHLRLERGLLTGIHLRGSNELVLGNGILVSEKTSLDQLPAQRVALKEAAHALAESLSTSSLSPLAQSALRKILAQLDQSASAKDDDFSPELVRHLLRNDWLANDFTTNVAYANLRHALVQAMTLQKGQTFRGDGMALVEWVNALKNRVFVLTTPTGNSRLQNHAQSPYDAPTSAPTSAPTTRMLVQYFPAEVDPLTSTLPTRAEVWWGRERLAWWDAQSGFSADVARWRTVLPDNGDGVGVQTIEEWRPPHLVLSDPNGALTALCTMHGMLCPAVAGNHDDQERFLADAARCLPDAKYLDLIGQYLFSYVHDSPDPQRPELIGVHGFSGDIHQTVEQTVKTVCDGQMRGDCDDLSEVYHHLLTRQGRLPHIFSLPGHAACAWSVHEGDLWKTRVLHTGQPLEFSADTLEKTLAQLFKHFDPNDTNSGATVSLLLRFAGENTRSHWRLGSRIMYDQEYAQKMIAVQRDWYFYTHAHAIATMQGMIAAGDNDNANWSELSGLYRRTGQWAAAMAAERTSLALRKDPLERLDAQFTVVSLLARAHHVDATLREAHALLRSLDDHFTDQPTVRMKYMQNLYLYLSDDAYHEIRQTVISQLFPHVEKQRQDLSQWARTRFNRRAWIEQAREERFSAELVIHATAKTFMHDTTPLINQPVLQQQLLFADRWLNELAFLDTGERDDVMAAYALVGQLDSALIGEAEFDMLLDQASEPTMWTDSHRKRLSGLPQLRLDLPWIRICVPYWAERLSSCMGGHQNPIDEKNALHLIARLQSAIDSCARLEMNAPYLDQTRRWVGLMDSLLRHDEDGLRSLFRRYAERHDRKSDEMLTNNLAALARHLPPTWFRRVLTLWDETAATKPGYFALAWGCAQSEAIPQALEVGALAAQRFADDPAFVDEFIYLQHVLAGGTSP